MAYKRIDPWVKWEPCDVGYSEDVLSQLAEQVPALFSGTAPRPSNASSLSFYEDHRLMELSFLRDDMVERAYVLVGSDGVHWLNGDSTPIHIVNANESLSLSNGTVADYLRYFLYFLRSDGSAFILIESPEEIESASDDAVAAAELGDEGGISIETARKHVRPLEIRRQDRSGSWQVDATVAYQGGLFSASFSVKPDGEVEMIEDDPLGSLGTLLIPCAPSLHLREQPRRAGEDVQSGAAIRRSDGNVTLSRDRDVTEAVVAVLLEEAIDRLNDAASGATLLRHFNFRTQPGRPIEQLARLLTDSTPFVIVESDIPFVEDFVDALTTEKAGRFSAAVRATAVRGDDLQCEIAVNAQCERYLLSFHTYRSLFDDERVAYDLALSDATVLIGCNRVSDVPEPLRRVADLVITFPRIDRYQFSRIFQRVFHAEPSPGWDEPGADWTRYLVPADFHTPRRLDLGPEDSLRLLRERVDARLEQVDSDKGLRLDQLHGMGEARQVAEDMVEDIQAAQAGQVPWSAVDRGMLLIGAPGTGKTTLARAIAKECGVNFVTASASTWQAAGALDAHLRAMRGDFAEARRYAPAIMFIDEIDSIGSRDQLSGQNSVYQTDVINALLEEIQGIESAETVIVIGATNYLEKVDPALRRAGRLDQVVEIPLPNLDGLQQIFEHYLAEFRMDGGSVGEVETRSLAELAFGLTGADIEFFIRGEREELGGRAGRLIRRTSWRRSRDDPVEPTARRVRSRRNAPCGGARSRPRCRSTHQLDARRRPGFRDDRSSVGWLTGIRGVIATRNGGHDTSDDARVPADGAGGAGGRGDRVRYR